MTSSRNSFPRSPLGTLWVLLGLALCYEAFAAGTLEIASCQVSALEVTVAVHNPTSRGLAGHVVVEIDGLGSITKRVKVLPGRTVVVGIDLATITDDSDPISIVDDPNPIGPISVQIIVEDPEPVGP